VSGGGSGWEILKKDVVEREGGREGGESPLVALASPMQGQGGGRILSPKALMAKGLGLEGGGGLQQKEEEEEEGRRGGREGVLGLFSPTSLRLDDRAQRTLEGMIHQAQADEKAAAAAAAAAAAVNYGGGFSLASSSSLGPSPRISVGGGGREGGREGGQGGLPSAVRSEELVQGHDLPSVRGNGLHLPIPSAPPSTNGESLTATAASAAAAGGGDGDCGVPRLRLVGSAPLMLHRDRVSSVRWAEGGREGERALCSTSDDGSFRVSALVLDEEDGREGGREGELLKASLRSKRHFSPSEIALSCCALVGEGGREGGREGGLVAG